MAIRPVFVFSVSRSGSTLVQRVIGSHAGIATASEPWLLLSLAYTLRPRGVDAEYVHPLMVEAIDDFCATLPGGRADYLAELRRFALSLYEKSAAPGDVAFLDKSPPYCLVAEEIMSLFPEGRFVFLWRNPLSILASMIETWGPWHPTMMSSDLFLGLPRLIAAYEAHRERAFAVGFEELTGAGGEAERAWSELMGYLGVPFEPDALERFAELRLNGRMGDPTGVGRYDRISAEPREKWRRALGNPLRREWARRYLRFLGAPRLAEIGYRLGALEADLDRSPTELDALAGDLGRAAVDVLKEPIRTRTHARRIGTPSPIRQLLLAGT